jgi:hypothetical protein
MRYRIWLSYFSPAGSWRLIGTRRD